MFNVGLTTTLSPSLVIDIRLVYLRDVNLTGVPQEGTGVSLASLGFNTPWNRTGGIGNINPGAQRRPFFLLLDCASVLRAVIRLSPDGTKYTILADHFEGKRLNPPNDVVLGPDGAIYLTDPNL
jgi:hypothetical protein